MAFPSSSLRRCTRKFRRATCNQLHLPLNRTPRKIGTYLMSDPWNGGDEMLKWRASKTRAVLPML